MADFDVIAAVLRRQRKDIDEQMESTASRSTETAVLVEKIEDLRRRAEKAQERFSASKIER